MSAATFSKNAIMVSSVRLLPSVYASGGFMNQGLMSVSSLGGACFLAPDEPSYYGVKHEIRSLTTLSLRCLFVFVVSRASSIVLPSRVRLI